MLNVDLEKRMISAFRELEEACQSLNSLISGCTLNSEWDHKRLHGRTIAVKERGKDFKAAFKQFMEEE